MRPVTFPGSRPRESQSGAQGHEFGQCGRRPVSNRFSPRIMETIPLRRPREAVHQVARISPGCRRAVVKYAP